MKRVFVMGAYGCGNRGDDAILQSICEQFSEYEIYAANGTYEDVSTYLPVKTIPCRLNEGFSLSVLGSMIKDAFKIMEVITKSDMLIFGGGSLIHDLKPYNLPFLYFWHAWAKLLRKKVCYFSMGVGPLNTKMGRYLSKRFLKSADGLFVRDYRGYNICKELGLSNVVLTADAAFAVTQKNQCNGSTLKEMKLNKQEYFCVTGSQWFKSSNFWNRDQMDFSAATKNFADMIRVTAEKLQQPIVFVPTVMHDNELAENIRPYLEDLDYRIVPFDWNCKQMAEIIENSSFLLGVRMHSIIFAARQQVPFVALIYDGKVSELLEYLDMQDVAISLETANAQSIASLCEFVHQNRIKIENKLLLQCKKLEKKVLDSVTCIHE